MKKPLLKLEELLQYIDSAFLTLFAAISIQIIVFVLWIYGVLTSHTLDELNTLSLTEWHQGIKTMWYASWNATAVILLVLVGYLFMRDRIKTKLAKKQKTADALHFEYAYIEMRNLLAYTFNVIAGEINDGVTPLDAGDKALKQRRELALNVVCKQTYNLNKSAHPITLEQHDTLLKQFEHYLTLITCDAAPDHAFTYRHPQLNHLRYPDFEKEYELECEQFNRQSIDKNEEKQ